METINDGIATGKGSQARKTWAALCITCAGVLIAVLDTTIVSIALPTIGADLHFPDVSLVWVMDAYLLTSGGFLIVGGRLGDYYGEKRLFLLGIATFCAASLACGLANSQQTLITARAIQGIAGAIIETVGLAIVTKLFSGTRERVLAMGVYASVGAMGGALGVLLGGVITSSLSWHWVFFVNVPAGIAIGALCLVLLPEMRYHERPPPLNLGGAASITLSSLVAIYAIVNANKVGWTSLRTLGTLATSAMLLIVFEWIEHRVSTPLIPRTVRKLPNAVITNIAAGLWSVALFSWLFNGVLYLQFARGLTPVQISLAFLPSNLAMAACAVGLSPKLVLRYGTKRSIILGMLTGAVGLLILACVHMNSNIALAALPGMLLIGIGGGIALNPLMLVAMSGADPLDCGLVSGILNTSMLLGGALGIAILGALSMIWTAHFTALGVAPRDALADGYQVGFFVGAGGAALAAGLVGSLLRPIQESASKQVSAPRTS